MNFDHEIQAQGELEEGYHEYLSTLVLLRILLRLFQYLTALFEYILLSNQTLPLQYMK